MKQNHPERQSDEIYLFNSVQEHFGQVGWKTKRIGLVAFDVNGTIIPPAKETLYGTPWREGEAAPIFGTLYPVFIKITEADEEGMKYDENFNVDWKATEANQLWKERRRKI